MLPCNNHKKLSLYIVILDNIFFVSEIFSADMIYYLINIIKHISMFYCSYKDHGRILFALYITEPEAEAKYSRSLVFGFNANNDL
jgi:hypothetical protein